VQNIDLRPGAVNYANVENLAGVIWYGDGSHRVVRYDEMYRMDLLLELACRSAY
jgi:hypothetical protein